MRKITILKWIRQRELLLYLLIKCSAAGFTLFCIYLLLMFISADYYSAAKTIKEINLISFLFIYCIICSMLIDLLLKHINHFLNPSLAIILMMTLYFTSGFVYLTLSSSYWNFSGGFTFNTIAGIISIVFLCGTVIFHRVKTQIIFGIIIPILIFTIISFTLLNQKDQWVEHRTENSYTASFQYFRGEKKIPISLNQGETLHFWVKWNLDKKGGYGYHVEDEKGNYIAMGNEEEFSKIKTLNTRTYYIVINVEGAKGGFSVNWQLE
ncbi:hypothetical protein [Chengkuizengella axinellae]|uniref:Uncharacterized protein n=1 Tax=Chengkuizengella axinellae TaxID=3064388 RepID=A0ABT9J1C5_9BACL|nr:hypothetical protein [Chengkuizengella sp. 2205SS18-9]MDP5275407.1 hypothetical protein [Chengkuizengella sp. 2205SS18-9]